MGLLYLIKPHFGQKYFLVQALAHGTLGLWILKASGLHLYSFLSLFLFDFGNQSTDMPQTKNGVNFLRFSVFLLCYSWA